MRTAALTLILVQSVLMRAEDSDSVQAGAPAIDMRSEVISGFKFVRSDPGELQPAALAAGKDGMAVNPGKAGAPLSPDLGVTGLVILPKITVEETEPRLSKEEILTDKGTLELAESRYINPFYRLTFGPLSQIAAYVANVPTILYGWHPSEAEAMALYRQDLRLEKLSELDSLIDLEKMEGTKGAKDLQRVRNEIYLFSR